MFWLVVQEFEFQEQILIEYYHKLNENIFFSVFKKYSKYYNSTYSLIFTQILYIGGFLVNFSTKNEVQNY